MLFRCLEDIVERLHHYLFEPRVDRRFAPEEVLEVLHPLEVAHGDSAGVAKDVGDEEDALVEKDAVGLGACRPVRSLRDDLRLDPRGIVLTDLVLDRRRNEDVAVELEELRVRDPLRTREPGDGAGLPLVGIDAVRIKAL